MEEPEASLRLRMLAGEPVTVQVEPVVVGAAAGPGLEVLAVLRIGHGHAAPVAVGPVHKPIPAVRIEHGIDDEHSLRQQRIDLRSASRRQVVKRKQRRFGAAGFVAMDAVAQVGDDRHTGQFGVGDGRRIVRKPQVGPADLLQTHQVFGRRNDCVDQRPSLVGAAVLLDQHPIAGCRHGLKVGHDLMRSGVTRTHHVPDYLLRLRNSRIVGHGFRQRQGQRKGGLALYDLRAAYAQPQQHTSKQTLEQTLHGHLSV